MDDRNSEGKLEMIRCSVLLAFAAVGLFGGVGVADEVSVVGDRDRVVNEIDERVYGHFLEHIYHSCNGGLWGELIWDRSFEGGGTGVAWRHGDGCLVQEGAGTNVRLVFGDVDWADYEFTLEARKTDGAEGFLILLRALSEKVFYWANLGGWGNEGCALERGMDGDGQWGVVTPRDGTRIESDRWYAIRARCEGPGIKVWVDGKLVIDYKDDGKGPERGRVGVGTWSTQAEFRNLKVTSLEGKTLHEGLPPIPKADLEAAPGWRVAGSADVSTLAEGALNGDKCKLIATSGDAGGLAQAPMKIEAGETYRGSLWVRGEAADGLHVQLLDGDKVLAEQVLPKPAAEWEERAIELKSTGSSDHAALQITVGGKSAVCLDQVSLMPESWQKDGGYRPDLLGAIAGLRPPVIRWPGGCFASPYRWKDGIGPQHKRGPHPKTMWDDKEVNSFGTDEFVAMCRKIGAEPLIVVNIGTQEWNRDVLDNDFLQEVLDWIEYCNGPADSTWGKVRAANGHPEPYNVKYWEIDNETWHMRAEAYAEWVNRFGAAMRKADPSIKLMACGSGGYDQAWNRTIINDSGGNFDYISVHHYEEPDKYDSGPLKMEKYYQELKTVIAEGPNPAIKIYSSEWNAQSTDWRTGLYCGGILNVFERCGDFFAIGGPALFLRHVSATGWDNAFINFDHRTWFPAPNYVVMKLWREHYAPHRIALEGDAGRLNLVATKSGDSKTVYLKAVNPTENAVPVTFTLDGDDIGKAALRIVAPGGLDARNTLDAPDAVRPEPAEIAVKGDRVTFELPSYSAGVATLDVTE